LVAPIENLDWSATILQPDRLCRAHRSLKDHSTWVCSARSGRGVHDHTDFQG